MTALVLVAAGSGQRLGADVPKALVRISHRSLIEHCLQTASVVERIEQIVVVVPAADVDTVSAQVSAFGATVVPGADSRDGSVRAGLDALLNATDKVLIHDAARPLTPADVYERVLDALGHGARAVVPAVPVADTVKRARDGIVLETVDRSQLVAVQTPQGFDVSTLRDAHGRPTVHVTDDAMRIEDAGVAVHVVEGSQWAFKITTPFDLMVAESILERS